MTRLAIPRRLLELCVAAADAALPHEEGGILLGSRDGRGDRFVRHVIGSGPGARRARTWLEVDHDWQNRRIRELADRGGDAAFLADWHSHPDATDAALSRLDVATLAKLAGFTPLGCHDPAMMILFRGADGWRAGAWRLAPGAGRPRGVAPVGVEVVDEVTP